jgi:site-specific DNA-methyltransferase (adenine-specific)
MSKELKFDFDNKKVIKGYPELRWTGKRPFTSSFYYPAQLKEKYGKPDKDGWMNKIFWGDNLQVMSHMLKDYRGKIDLIYIDPPFDSKADYKKKIKLRGQEITNDSNSFEEKQYGDIWTNDEYLQFMYERLILLRELLSDKGSIYVHCDYRKSSHLRLIMDEIFGPGNFKNEIIWRYRRWPAPQKSFQKMHDNILFYSKTSTVIWNQQYESKSASTLKAFGDTKLTTEITEKGTVKKVKTEEKSLGTYLSDVWELPMLQGSASKERESSGNYPTQKPESLLEKIILSSSSENSIVFDCFMGSGTTAVVAHKNKRKFIGADINLGATQTTITRLNKLNVSNPNFEVYNVNNYDIFRNPLEAKKLIIEALELQSLDNLSIFDGEKDGRIYKILSINRIASKADLSDLIANLPYKLYDQKLRENAGEPVDKITLVTMGHEPDLKGALEKELSKYKIDIDVIDLLRSDSKLEFKRESEAEIIVEGGFLEIKSFYPMNLLQKLSLDRMEIENWKQLVESIMIDFNYDGNVLSPSISDIPEKNKLVNGKYKIPLGAKKIKIKITDLLSESLEKEIDL